MGTKGRDLALYVFFTSAFLVITGRCLGLSVMLFFLVTSIAFLAILYSCYTTVIARKESKKLGLKHVVLLPVAYWWAMWIIKISGGQIKDRGRRAFEVHIEKSAPDSLSRFLKDLDHDLSLAKNKLPGTLFFWETPVPVPASIRQLIREKQKEGNALWERGGWKLPRFPFGGRDLKRGILRRGAILILEESEVGRDSE